MKQYIEKVCSTCKGGECHITKFIENGIVYTKCINYIKDSSKIEGYKKPLDKTANHTRMVMPKLVSDWSRV